MDFIKEPFRLLLEFINGWTGNFGWTLIIFGVLVKLLLTWPTAKAKKSTMKMSRLAPKVQICIHIINGLPGETREDMLATARAVAALHPDQVKIHLMHVLSGTALGRMYEEGKYIPMTQEDYVSVTVDQLELLPPDTVIGRLTGDGLSDELLAPTGAVRKPSF